MNFVAELADLSLHGLINSAGSRNRTTDYEKQRERECKMHASRPI
ncbi:MAG: hypothetical protein WA326_04210 [Nitrososphaeraceae archaeon]